MPKKKPAKKAATKPAVQQKGNLMADPTPAELQAQIDTLNATVSTMNTQLQEAVTALKEYGIHLGAQPPTQQAQEPPQQQEQQAQGDGEQHG